MAKFRWKLFICWILSMIVVTAIMVIFDFLPWDPVGILAGYGFIVFIGYLIHKSGLAKYMGYKE